MADSEKPGDMRYLLQRQNLLPHLIKERAECTPDRPLVEEIESGQRQSYAEFHHAAIQWSNTLSELHVSRNDTVATIFPTSIAALQVWMGIAWLRAIEVPLNNEYVGAMLAKLVVRSRARVLVIANEFADRLGQIAKDCPALEAVIIPDGKVRPDLPIRTLIAEDLISAKTQSWEGPSHYDPLGIVFTSGTTGASKGVVVPWAQLADAVNSNFPGDKSSDYDDGAYYCPWPPYNLLGKGAFDIAVRQGLRFVLRRRFSQSNFWSDVCAYRCTHAAIPFIGPWLWRQAPSPDDAANPLRRVLMVPVMSEHADFAKRFGVRISTGYATTECGYAIGTANPVIPASCGRVNDGFEVRIVDEHDEMVAPGELGELMVRHKEPWHQMTNYFDDPTATASAWRNGWYHTGDAFRYDNEGNLFFSGRLKDYIKHRGQNISSSDLEMQTVEHPDVVECACVGISTELAGEGGFADEDIKLFVVKATHSSLTEWDLYSFLKDRIPRFMYPQCIEFIDAMPRGELNKVLKRVLRTRAEGGVFFRRGMEIST